MGYFLLLRELAVAFNLFLNNTLIIKLLCLILWYIRNVSNTMHSGIAVIKFKALVIQSGCKTPN